MTTYHYLILYKYFLLLGMPGGKSSIKLKASDIYSDDSGSDSEEKRSEKRSTSSSRSSSDSEEDGTTKTIAGAYKLLSNIDIDILLNILIGYLMMIL